MPILPFKMTFFWNIFKYKFGENLRKPTKELLHKQYGGHGSKALVRGFIIIFSARMKAMEPFGQYLLYTTWRRRDFLNIKRMHLET